MEFRDFDCRAYSEDGSLTEDHELRKWSRQFINTFRNWGREPAPGPVLKAWVEATGFVNITHQIMKVPLGLWPRDPQFVCETLHYTLFERNADIIKFMLHQKEIGAYTLIQ